MAMFPTHIKCSTMLGIGCGAAAYVGYGVPLPTCLVGAGLCSVGGILPDIDSGPGIPLREITTFLASVVPTMLITRLLSYNFNQETLILAGGSIYIAIRFGLAYFLRHHTVHRGMFHSFPSMAIFGELTYLLFYGESMFVRLFMVSAVCLGFFCHLLLDEIYSVEWDGRPHLKRSFGTAMKFVGPEWFPNLFCYAKLAVLTFVVMNDPSVVQQVYAGQGEQVAKNLGQTIKDEFNSAVATTGVKPLRNSRFPRPRFPFRPPDGKRPNEPGQRKFNVTKLTLGGQCGRRGSQQWLSQPDGVWAGSGLLVGVRNRVCRRTTPSNGFSRHGRLRPLSRPPPHPLPTGSGNRPAS